MKVDKPEYIRIKSEHASEGTGECIHRMEESGKSHVW